MIILIPLGGVGNRFKKNGYIEPKALIRIFGKPILYYLLDNLEISNDTLVYIPYNKEYAKYRFEDRLKKDYPNTNFKFLCLSENTGGAAETINIALHHLEDLHDQPILCLDGDNFYSNDIITLWDGMNTLITFKDNNDNNDNPIYSYVKVDDNNNVIDIIEKEKISQYACTGAYGFSSYKNLLKYSSLVIEKKIKQKGEYYTSSVIREMINNGIQFSNSVICKKYWNCLGTPIQLRQFYNNYPRVSCLNNKKKNNDLRICFDLDNTLVSFPKNRKDYTTVEPIVKNINFLKYLKSFGHTIIIYTARRMKTYKGNEGKVLCDIGKITFDTLEKFDIPFDEIYFGKPYADVYIDDLALNCFDDMEKMLGFYMDSILPRDFNEIRYDFMETFTKKSNDLTGEIYYYNNIPVEIKDMFPIMIDYDKNNKWYTIEKINGLTCTSLYLSELLTTNNLKHIMNSINRIQSTKTTVEQNINVYENYANKLTKRYYSYDYSKFKENDKVYHFLLKKLELYEKEDKGRFTVIHGDTVMTNILINNYGKIKFIDMRGKVGDTLTIFGDWLYDWAKLYQSLIGYDKILQAKEINNRYEKTMITFFEEYFVQLYSENDLENLKLITNSLLFSLIPLHDNEKCVHYYNLIKI